MEALILFGRWIAPFAIDCTARISLAALAGLAAAHLLGPRRPARAFAFIAAAFGLAAVLTFARGHIRFDGEPLDRPFATEIHAAPAVPGEGEPLPVPAGTGTPGLVAKYGSMFQIRLAPQAPSDGGGRSTPWIPALGLLWTAGFLATILYRLLGWILVRRRLARATPADPRIARAAETVRETVEAFRAEVRISERRGSPCVAGLLRPVILLPVQSATWPGERLLPALLHEYLHVKRLDVPVAEGLRFLASLAWFSPFPWMALAAAFRLREEACDEAVLEADIPPAAYALELLASARELDPVRQPVAALGGTSLLEQRIRRVLEVRPRRRFLLRTAGAALLLASAACLIRMTAPLYALPEFGEDEARPQGPREWVAAEDPRSGPASRQGAFSLARSGGYTCLRLRFRGRETEFRFPTSTLPGTLPLTPRARMIVPYGSLQDAQSGRPFFNPGWSIWDDRQVPVMAAGTGRVAINRIDPRFGPLIEVDHGQGLRTRYALGRRGCSLVQAGDFVLAGAPLGRFGACAPCDLPTLNFSVILAAGGDQVALDPAPFLFAAGNREAPLAASVVNAAVRLGDRCELQRLAGCGIDLNIPSADGTLPLEWALMGQDPALVQDLLRAGADPQTPTWNVHQPHIALHGPTVAELAKDTGLAGLLAPE
jgi:hypothetical protein